MKRLFNFYLDDADKKDAQDKLARLCGEQNKGQLASLLRVFIRQFIATADEEINPLLIKAIETEYVYSTTLNKRSRM